MVLINYFNYTLIYLFIWNVILQKKMESEINTKTLIDDNHQLNKISTGNIMYLLQVIA